uniref:Ribosomal protein L11 methyltransferase n=1 Tax=Cyanothece sp. (strain PCC 7425 / ATCC 29141) TaxID=395961 RepID=PRMA_CYAP4|nr:RecName: Full=Ribosomal protein L11 methyltransferase; Short=L11 Mtase [Cyanothece sp. PCC 7425]
MVSSWWEIQVVGDAALEEGISWRLQSFGCQGTASQKQNHDCHMTGYLPQKQVNHLDLAALSLWLAQDAIALGFLPPTTRWKLINEEDWATSWQQYWHPQEVGDRLLIYPAWLDLPEHCERLLLRLDPGVAFGTGTHPTTQLCLEALEMHLDQTFGPVEQVTVADIGCGTGILSIAALRLGAKQAFAVDLDPLAVESADRSRDLNEIPPEQMIVQQGSVEQVPHPVQGIVCNILAETIIDLIPTLATISQPHTWAAFSGILVTQAKSVVDALEQQGWQVGSLWQRQDWCCINAHRL